jgi:hypothetical protein
VNNITNKEIYNTAISFLKEVYGEVPRKRFSGLRLGIEIAKRLNVRVSRDSSLLDQFLKKIDLDLRDSQLGENIFNCSQIEVDTGFRMAHISAPYIEFLQKGEIRVADPRLIFEKICPNGGDEVFSEFEKYSLFFDRTQKRIIEVFRTSKISVKRTKRLLDLGWLKVIVPSSVMGYYALYNFIEQLIHCSKTQKNNISLLFSSPRRRTVTSRLFHVLEYLLSEKREISKGALKALKDMKDQELVRVCTFSIVNARANGVPFIEWLRVFTYAKNCGYPIALEMILSSPFKSLEDFKTQLTEKLSLKKEIKFDRVVEDIYDERSGILIKQIVNAFDLVEEGAEMHHCVGTYEDDCLEKRTVIFSVRGKERYTIEFSLNPDEEEMKDSEVYHLVQFKGKYNSKPDEGDYWTVLRIIEEHSSMFEITLALPAPGTEMVW